MYMTWNLRFDFLFLWDILNMKSEFRQNYRTILAHISTFAARISRVVADVQAPGSESGNV